MTELETLQEINSNIKKLIAVMATQGMTTDIKIKTLQNMGLNSREISELTGIPIPTVKAKWIKGK